MIPETLELINTLLQGGILTVVVLIWDQLRRVRKEADEMDDRQRAMKSIIDRIDGRLSQLERFFPVIGAQKEQTK